MSPLISHAVLEEIRAASDIVTVISSYFQLQRGGANYKALCPFHKEKTPSFMVNPQRQIFHCFGCGAGGDVFRFVMNYEKVDFITAVKMLAQKANIRVTFDSVSEQEKMAKNVLYEIMSGAAHLYHKILTHNPEAEAARKYLAARRLDEKVAADFLIGYAPNRPDTILQWAGKKYQRAQLEAAGLIVSSTGGNTAASARRGGAFGEAWDRFRDRLMFPIHDEQGRVVGFSGRILRDDPQAAKYVNTPETILFHKGRLLYAMAKARKNIVEQHEAIVCEGQIDVIRCHLAGFNSAVAAQGTAFTDDHARILKRYADGVILAFDPDAAGQKAALRAAEIFLRAGLAVRVAVLPKGTDPDSLILQKDGQAAFQDILEKAQSVVDFQIDVLSAESGRKTEAELMRISAQVLNLVAQAANTVQRAVMLKNASRRLDITEHALSTELSRLERRRHAYAAPEGGESVDTQDNEKIPEKEFALLTHLLLEPKLTALAKKYLPLELITNERCRRLISISFAAGEGDLMNMIAREDDENRQLSNLAAHALTAPARIKSEFATHEESVKALILALRRDALQKKRKEIELKLQAARLEGGVKLPDTERKQLEIEHIQLGYDLVKLKYWDTALPVLELI
jgi:DNA primase